MQFHDRLLSDIVAFRTYARYLPDSKRRESLTETTDRYLGMMHTKFPQLSDEINRQGQFIHQKKAMPSMRAFQFAGPAIEQNNARIFNCAFKAVSNERAFGEILYLLLSGCGVGFSVQEHHVARLGKVKQPKEAGIHFVQDSIQGWAQALDLLVDAYLLGRVRPQFDYGFIRDKGSLLKTTGAKAPGPEPLKKMLEAVEILLKKAVGRKLRPIDVYDIVCLVSECVRAGGIRRAALIALFSKTDKEMLHAKTGDWFKTHPWRARSNNSVILLRQTTNWEEFAEIFQVLRESGSGEPGFYWTNDLELGTNPCVEISLRGDQFCNLSTVNQTACLTAQDLYEAAKAASFFGTLQASFTDFAYLNPTWQKNTEEDALLGVSFTGIADAHGRFSRGHINEAAWYATEENYRAAWQIGINKAARVTAIKPEGSSSTVLGSSSGIHARHAPFYLRRIRLGADDGALVEYLKAKVPELMEDDKYDSNSIIITIPQKSPAGALTRQKESAIGLFNRAIEYNQGWVNTGHRSGTNTNNVSCTLSVRENEWGTLKNLMWSQRDSYNGMSILPYDGGTYVQAPFEECDEATYDKYARLTSTLDLKEIVEEQDYTNMTEIIACAGGSCEI